MKWERVVQRFEIGKERVEYMDSNQETEQMRWETGKRINVIETACKQIDWISILFI